MNEINYFKKQKDIVYLGINEDEQSYNTVKYYVKNNITFALLNYTYGTNGIDLPSDKPWLVNLMNKDKVTKDIKEARENADVVIVFPHWGRKTALVYLIIKRNILSFSVLSELTLLSVVTLTLFSRLKRLLMTRGTKCLSIILSVISFLIKLKLTNFAAVWQVLILKRKTAKSQLRANLYRL